MSSSPSNGRRRRRRKRKEGQQAEASNQPETTQPSTAALVAEGPSSDADNTVEDIGQPDVVDKAEEAQVSDTPLETLPESDVDVNTDPSSDVGLAEESESEAGAGQAIGVTEMTSELVEKDELIAALTRQLEDAAERLDRLHRAGADRAPIGKSSSPAGPAPYELTEYVGQLLQAWEDLDALTWMQEFDRKLDGLTSLVASSKRSDSGSPQSRPPVELITDSWLGRLSESADDDGDREETLASRLAGWEEMKAQFMQEGGEQVRDRQVGDTEVEFRVADETPAAPPAQGAPPAWDLKAPEPVDLENADRDALVAAVEERDDFISHLIRRLHSIPTGRPQPVDWAALNNAPEELRAHLQELEARLDEVLRMEECDLSLERARLARERAQLEQMRRRNRQRGKSEISDSSPDQSDETEVSQDERRWLRVFGFGRSAGALTPDDDEPDEIT